LTTAEAQEFLVKPSASSALARLRTYLNIVIDASSSMGAVRMATIEACNRFLEGQRHDRVDELFVTLTLFNRDVVVRYTARPIREAPLLSEATYVPEGSTALYDGVYHTLVAMERKVGVNARVLTVILTDGEENASTEIKTVDTFRGIIRDREARGNWTFVLLAAGSNAYKNGAAMGFQKGNVQQYSAANVTDAIAVVARGVTGYRHADHLQTRDFYTAPKFRRPQWPQDSEP
jgi:hypothetical protein